VSWLVALACTVTIGATLLVPHRVDGSRLLTIGAGLLTVGGLGTAAALMADRGLAGLAVAFALSGLLAVVMVPANIVVSTELPSHVRASALSILLGSLYAAQAVVPVLSGAAADAVGVTATCAVVMLLAGLYGAFALSRPVTVPARRPDAPEPMDLGLADPELGPSRLPRPRSTVEVPA
jgi:MFS family permease